MSLINADFILALAALVTAIGGLVKIFVDGKTARKKYSDLSNRFNQLQAEHAKLNSSFQELVRLLGEKDKKVDDLEAESRIIRADYDALKSKYDALDARYETLRIQYDMLKAQYEALCQVNATLEKQLAIVAKKTGPLPSEP